jgi:hypothetical protein
VKHLVTVIDWYGPYSYKHALAVCKEDYAGGLYLCIGKLKGQRGKPRLQYIGIAGSDIGSRLRHPSHKVHSVTIEQEFWLGEVNSLGIPGKKLKKTNPSLDFAEWALVYFLNPGLNEKKIISPPNRPVTVLNRWWRPDYETPWIQRPHADLPDLIDYLGPEVRAKLVWFKSVRRVDVSQNG